MIELLVIKLIVSALASVSFIKNDSSHFVRMQAMTVLLLKVLNYRSAAIYCSLHIISLVSR